MSNDLQSIADKYSATGFNDTNKTPGRDVDDIDLTAALTKRLEASDTSQPAKVESRTRPSTPKLRVISQ